MRIVRKWVGVTEQGEKRQVFTIAPESDGDCELPPEILALVEAEARRLQEKGDQEGKIRTF
jgi:hypothetical protein